MKPAILDNDTATPRPGGEMAERVRTFDWSQTPLGPLETWPRSLSAYVSMVLELPSPAIIFWGPEQTQIYNEGYAVIMGPRHPEYFGRPYRECWPDTHPIIQPWMDEVLAGGVIRVDRTQFTLTRHGFTEEAYFTFTFSPLRDDEGVVRGILQPVVEVTATVLAERRAGVLTALSPTGGATSVDELAELLATSPADVPFAAVYEWDEPRQTLSLAGASANLRGVDLEALAGPAADAFARGEATTIDGVDALLGGVHTGPWPEPTRAARMVPVRRATRHGFSGVVVFGTSPRLQLDEDYRSFLGAAARRVATRLEIERLRAGADQERERLAGLLAQAPAMICMLEGPEHVFTLANPRYRDLVGNRPLIGRTIREALPEIAGQGFFELLDHVYATGEPFVGSEMRVLLRRAPGAAPEETFLTFLYQPYRDGSGRIEGVLAFAFDVTPQIRARQDAEASRALLETVVEHMPAGVVVAEAPSGRTILANSAVARILGYPAIPAASLEDYAAYTGVDADGRPLAADEYPLVRALRGETTLEREITFVHGSGARGAASVSAAPVYDGAGNLIAAVVTMTDITGRRHDEAQRRELLRSAEDARAEAEMANRAKDEFLAILGHELRNPLAPIMTALHLMRLRGAAAIEKERTIIERQAHHLLRLVDDLLDVSRITRGKVELKRQRVQIAEVVAKAIEMASPLLEQRQHELVVEVARGGLAVDGDPARLAQVIANLLTNAAKYTEAGGRVTVRAARRDGEVVVAVRDTGIGIAPEMLPRVFEMFVQEQQALDRAQGGLGLGLTIVRSLVALHGGGVEVHSEGHNRGAEFVVRLPASGEPDAAPEERPPAPPPERPEHAGTRVLVVDDNEDAAETLAEVLQQLGYRTAVAYDGPSALKRAEELRPEVALVDIGLPVMDGYEVARRLRAAPGTAGVRLVAITGYGQTADKERSKAAGFDVHLVKPVDADVLQAAIAGAGAA